MLYSLNTEYGTDVGNKINDLIIKEYLSLAACVKLSNMRCTKKYR